MRKLAVAVVLTALMLLAGPVRAADTSKPNIVFFLADDLGLDGVSCYGSDKHKTPQVDALAASGIRFTTCYAAPLCGPSRCLLMTGRYAFRTGGLQNQSWGKGRPGAKSADEQPVAKLLKQAGYATCQAGKWRQVGELPGNWGFDEFLTDQTATGWYWETKYNKNGREITLPEGTYSCDAYRDFALDFIRRNKDKPFFLYYASHLVHKPTLKTPDTPKAEADQSLYEQNIRYMDKEVGTLVAELEKLGLRKNTLFVFAGDNGTANGYPSTVHGRMINGNKGSMLEGGSRVPFIASWPAVTPAGKTCDDIISFADPHATFIDIAGVKPPDGFKIDGHSFLPQLRGEAGAPRKWGYVQLGDKWFVREPGYKMNERGQLFDMSDAPFVEKLISLDADTEQSKAARQRLSAALAELNPAAGKKDRADKVAEEPANKPEVRPAVAGSAGPWKSGDNLKGAGVPNIAGKAFEISAEVDDATGDGVLFSLGGKADGCAIYVEKGKLSFAVREERTLTQIIAKEPLPRGHLGVQATLAVDGKMTLSIDGKLVAEGKAAGPVPQQPRAGLSVGSSGRSEIGDYEAPATYAGKVTNVRVKTK